MNDILARRARRATVGIALSAALVAGIAPATAIAAETSSPTGAAVSQTSATSGNSGAPQTEDAAAAKEKAYAAMQEALKNLEAAKDAASPEKLAEIDDDIAAFQEIYDMVVTEAAKRREPLPAMQANVDAAQAKYDEAHNRTSGLQAELDKALEALGDEEPSTAIKEHIKQLRSEIMAAERREKSYEDDLHSYQRRLESQEKQVQHFESEAEEAKAHIDEDIAKRNALLGDLEKAQAAYDDACKAYEEAKAAADKATSPEITKPTETTPPLRLNATRRGDTARCLTCNRQRRPTKLHQAGELEQRQASKYDRRQAREHGRHSTERNSTRRNRRHGTRNNRHSHTPHQELKIADRAFCLHQSTNPEIKRGSFPQPRETSLFNCKNSSNSTAAS